MPSIKDVAYLTGLSVGTVSRVFNNRGYISDDTKEKVWKACRDLNYTPNEAARTLFTRKSTLVGALFPNLINPFYARLIQHIEEKLYVQGKKLLLCLSGDDPDKEKSYFDMLKAQQVCGVIIGSQTRGLEAYAGLDMPMVAFDRFLGSRIPCVCVDHGKAGAEAARLLLSAGCRHIAHPQGSSFFHSPSNARTKEFLLVLKTAGVEPVIIPMDLNQNFEQEKNHFSQILSSQNIDGFFGSDIQALTFLDLCKEKGISVPQKLKIIGFDGVPIPGVPEGLLATFVQPLEVLAQILVDRLLSFKEPLKTEDIIITAPAVFKFGKTLGEGIFR